MTLTEKPNVSPMANRHFHVYHFRPDIGDRDLNTLIENKLYSAKVQSLNDPYEFAALEALSELPEEQEYVKNIGVTCFCRSLTNPLLWAHYAAAHKGFALGYDSSDPCFGGDKPIKERGLHDVRYEDVKPSLEGRPMNDFMMAAITTKPTCWAYEQEIRFLLREGDVKFDEVQIGLKDVVFGANMTKERENEIRQAVEMAEIKVNFGRMEYMSEGYGVKPVWL